MEIRPWGHFKVLYKGKDYLIKELVIKPGGKTSLQYHNYRDEYWIVLKGKGKAILDDTEIDLEPGIFLKVPRTVKHRIINDGKEDLVIIEVWVGEKLDENDIVRLEDEYGRV